VYDRKKFLDAGIKHFDMYFIDGGNPTEAILKQYIEVVENERGAVGIHCKAGLGRTGVLNGCYLMKHYRLSANELIAWMRICRPGTVIGPQQQFLKEMEPKMWKLGDEWRKINGNDPPLGAPELPKPPPGWYDQPEADCTQEEELAAALKPRAAPASPARAGAYGGGSSSAYAGYQTRYSAQPASPTRGAYGGSSYSSASYSQRQQPAAQAAPREAPTRASGYGSSMAGRSVIGTSPYGSKAGAAPARGGGYARQAPAPVAGGYSSSRGASGSRYY